MSMNGMLYLEVVVFIYLFMLSICIIYNYIIGFGIIWLLYKCIVFGIWVGSLLV